MKKVLLKKPGLFGDRYEMVEIEERGDAIAALLTLMFLPEVVAGVIGFFILKLALKLAVASAIRISPRDR